MTHIININYGEMFTYAGEKYILVTREDYHDLDRAVNVNTGRIKIFDGTERVDNA